MVAAVSWYLEGYIIQVQVSGVINQETIRQMGAGIRQILTELPPGPVNVLIDLNDLDDIAISMIDLIQTTRQALPRDGIARMVVYNNPSSTFYFLLQTLSKTSDLPIRQVHTLHDALNYLRLRDNRLFMLNTNPSEGDKQRLS